MAFLLKLLKLIPGLLAAIQRQESARVAELERQVAAWKKDALDSDERARLITEAARDLNAERHRLQKLYLIEAQKFLDLQERERRLLIELDETKRTIARLSNREVAGQL